MDNQSIHCRYYKTIYANESNSFRIVSYSAKSELLPPELKTEAEKFSKLTAVGYGLPITEKVSIKLQGTWSEKKQYGLQFQVDSFEEELPKTSEGITSYLKSGYIKGIGKKTAELIVNYPTAVRI